MAKIGSKGAMEMSVGTIVTIVLLMSVLVLGLFFIQKIFSSSNNAIDSVNQQLTSQINQAFSNGQETKLAIYPTSRIVDVKRGASPPQGFAFSIYNDAKSNAVFNYTIRATDVSNCAGSITTQVANSYLIGGISSSPLPLGPGQALDNAVLVTVAAPQSAPTCTVVYTVNVYQNGNPYSSADVQVTLQ